MTKIINMIRKINIQKRLLLSFLIVIIVPNIILGIIIYQKSAIEVESSIEDYSTLMVADINKTISSKMNEYEQLTYRKFVVNTIIRNYLKECKALEYTEEEYISNRTYIENVLYDISTNDKNIINIEIITNKDEFQQVSHKGIKKGGFITDIDEFRTSEPYQKAVEAKSTPVWDDSVKEKSVFLMHGTAYHFEDHITLLRSINDETGDLLGVLVLSVSNKIFLDMNKMEKLFVNGNLLLVTNNRILVSINENVLVPIISDEIISLLKDKLEGNIIWSIGNVKYNVIYKRLEFGNLVLVYNIPHNILYEKVYRMRDIIIRVSIVCIIAAAILSYLVASSIYIPLKKLRKTMNMIDGKDFDVTYSDPVEDEIADLGVSFNLMLGRIHALMISLHETEVKQKNEEIRRKEAEIDAFQMQINPHLIYNTLDIIRWQAVFVENGEGEISKMIMSVSKLLRLSIKKSANLINIREEFDHVIAYQKVLQYRYKDKFKIEWHIDDKSLLDCKIVKLALQPLIENSIIHGMKNNDGPLTINITMKKEESDLYIRIQDNGRGMSDEVLEGVQENLQNESNTGKGVALYNINERIKLYFGNDYGLTLVSRLDVGTTFNVHIPYINDSSECG